MKKYELTGETKTVNGKTFRRVIPVSDSGVRIGENVWFESDIRVGSGVWIGSNVQIENNAWIGNGVRLGSNIRIESDVKIRSGVWIGNDIWIESGVWIESGIRIESGVWIESGIRIESGIQLRNRRSCSAFLITISGFLWPITIDRCFLRIGCEKHAIAEWREFSDDEIAEMDEDALEFWHKHKNWILKLGENILSDEKNKY